MSSRERLAQQICRIEALRNLPFDHPSFDAWRLETAEVLDQLFGRLNSEQHPCVRAFLSYRIPEHFTASRDEMQEFYANILNYQATLLAMYLDDIANSDV